MFCIIHLLCPFKIILYGNLVLNLNKIILGFLVHYANGEGIIKIIITLLFEVLSN